VRTLDPMVVEDCQGVTAEPVQVGAGRPRSRCTVTTLVVSQDVKVLTPDGDGTIPGAQIGAERVDDQESWGCAWRLTVSAGVQPDTICRRERDVTGGHRSP
jgi:hypothetical protein